MAHWLSILLLIFILKGISCDLWCFQCSWRSGSPGKEKLANCNDKDDDEGTALTPAKKINPIAAPICVGQIIPDFSNETGYELLKEKCYDYACQAPEGGGVCARWTFMLNDKVVNTTLFCAISQDTGCFDQPVEGGFTKRVCLCNNGRWCNTAVSTHSTKALVLLVGLLSSALFQFI